MCERRKGLWACSVSRSDDEDCVVRIGEIRVVRLCIVSFGGGVIMKEVVGRDGGGGADCERASGPSSIRNVWDHASRICINALAHHTARHVYSAERDSHVDNTQGKKTVTRVLRFESTKKKEKLLFSTTDNLDHPQRYSASPFGMSLSKPPPPS